MSDYEQRVRELEREALSTSDAQGVVDAERDELARQLHLAHQIEQQEVE